MRLPSIKTQIPLDFKLVIKYDEWTKMNRP